MRGQHARRTTRTNSVHAATHVDVAAGIDPPFDEDGQDDGGNQDPEQSPQVDPRSDLAGILLLHWLVVVLAVSLKQRSLLAVRRLALEGGVVGHIVDGDRPGVVNVNACSQVVPDVGGNESKILLLLSLS